MKCVNVSAMCNSTVMYRFIPQSGVSGIHECNDYGITYLFHDHRASANAYEQRDKLLALGRASVEWVMGRYFTPDTVLRDRRRN